LQVKSVAELQMKLADARGDREARHTLCSAAKRILLR
jgi:hypothetical protein